MIIQNGWIRYCYITNEGSINEVTGYASDSSVKLGHAVPCQYYSNTLDFLGKDGEGEAATKRSYTILIDYAEYAKPAQRLKLYDRFDKLISEFPIRSIVPLDAVRQLKILV